MKSHLSFEDLKQCFKNKQTIDWHDDYQHNYSKNNPGKCILTEEWKDRSGPLTIINLYTIDEKEGKIIYVGYKCSDLNCNRCINKNLTIVGHHKYLKINGMDIQPRYEFIETKKQTIIKTENQPVFKMVIS